MSRTVCLLGTGRGAEATAGAAVDLASTLGTQVAALHLVARAGRPPAVTAALPLQQRVTDDALAEAVSAGDQPDVAWLVLGAEDRFPGAGSRGGPGAVVRESDVTTELARRVSVPMFVVPASSPLGRDTHLARVLLAHDGTARTSVRLAGLADRLHDAGVELVVVHVLDPHSGHGLLQEGAYDLDAWRREFRLRHLHEDDLLTLRRGDPWQRVLQEARKVGADAILLGWGQYRDRTRAAVVRAALADPSVPLMLVPARPRVRSSASDEVPGRVAS